MADIERHIKSFDLGPELSTGLSLPTEEELNLINSKIIKPLQADDVRVFTIHLCNSKLDKSNEVMTKEFIEQYAALAEANRLPGQKDHKEEVDLTWCNVFQAWVEEVDGVYYAVARAYSLYNRNWSILEGIEYGLTTKVSVSFNGEGHYAQDQEGNEIYIWDKCTEAREFSLVVCPCQRSADITKSLSNSTEPTRTEEDKTNNTGGKKMKALEIFTKHFKKTVKSDDPTSAALLDLLENPDRELSEAELELREKVDALEAQLEEQKQSYEAKIAELEEQLKACGAKAEEIAAQTIEDRIDEEIEKMNPLTPVVKECIKKELNRETIKLNDEGALEGLSEQLEAARTKFDGLFKVVKSDEKQTKSSPFSTSTQKVNTGSNHSFDAACKKSFK